MSMADALDATPASPGKPLEGLMEPNERNCYPPYVLGLLLASAREQVAPRSFEGFILAVCPAEACPCRNLTLTIPVRETAEHKVEVAVWCPSCGDAMDIFAVFTPEEMAKVAQAGDQRPMPGVYL